MRIRDKVNDSWHWRRRLRRRCRWAYGRLRDDPGRSRFVAPTTARQREQHPNCKETNCQLELAKDKTFKKPGAIAYHTTRSRKPHPCEHRISTINIDQNYLKASLLTNNKYIGMYILYLLKLATSEKICRRQTRAMCFGMMSAASHEQHEPLVR